MPDLKITEAGTVQFPMVAHAAGIGWTQIDPEVAREKRGGDAGLLFREEVALALGRFNPWLTADAIRQVVENLESLPPTIEGNRELLSWLRGERQWYDEAEERHRRVRLVDFASPGENVLHVTWEWRLKPPARKGNRADVMFLVNGIPACIVEHKNPKDGAAIERGITQLRRYEIKTPELIGAAQLFNVTHLLDYWYGVTWKCEPAVHGAVEGASGRELRSLRDGSDGDVRCSDAGRTPQGGRFRRGQGVQPGSGDPAGGRGQV